MATASGVPTPVETHPLNHRPHRPWLAAVLSFIFPGLGQAYAGRPRTAAMFAVPVVLVITVALVLVGVLGATLRNALLSSAFLGGVLVVNALVFGWRGLAIWDAGLRHPSVVRGGQRTVAIASVGALLLLTLAMHGWVGIVVTHLDDTLTQVFDQAPGPVAGAGDDGADGEAPAEAPGDPINAPEYVWDGTKRINFLLVGTDAAPGRDEILTDVILVVSVDPVAHTAAMLSVPRDTGYLPLPDESIYPGGVFPAKANELAAVAAAAPEVWCPDAPHLTSTGCGIRSLQRSIGLYVGVELHHYALVDMAGFADIIDAIGGVELCLPGRLVDPLFGGTLSASQGETLVLPAGCHRYGGIDALAYARSRQGWIEMADGTVDHQTDFDRNERQQLVLLALREELADADTVFELPAVLRAIGETVTTDFPRDRAGDLASLLPVIAGPDIERVVLAYPEFVDAPLEPEVNYLLVPRRDALRDEMSRLFGASALTGWYLGTEAPSPDAAASDDDL